MAAWSTRKFRSVERMMDFLNGVVISPASIEGGLDLDGLTLIIDVGGSGNRTVTFAPALSRDWTPAEIIAEITGTHADLEDCKLYVENAVPGRSGGPSRSAMTRLALIDSAGAVITVRGNGTANSLFGFDSPATPANDTVGVPIADTEVEHIAEDNYGGQATWTVVMYK